MNRCELCNKPIPAHFPMHACTPDAPAPPTGRPRGVVKQRVHIYLPLDVLAKLDAVQSVTRSTFIENALRSCLEMDDVPRELDDAHEKARAAHRHEGEAPEKDHA